jgi:hypothetical protein
MTFCNLESIKIVKPDFYLLFGNKARVKFVLNCLNIK